MNSLYAIVDIETTGGQASNGCITEIAIRIHDGEKVIESFDSLIKPFYYIPRHITELTGITNDMVSNSPTFEELASQIFNLLEKKIFVAHNVNFDYSFIKSHLLHSGYEFDAQKLCTVRLSRKIFPKLPSYSLGNLTASLNIELKNRHRAAGDTDATVKLFELLLKNDHENIIAKQMKKKSGEQNLPANLSKDKLDHLPNSAGVYYFHNNKGKIVYIGKAINIKKRVKSHFIGNKITRQRQDFLRDIFDVSYETTSTELIALITEAIEIKKHWPKYNKALKGVEPKYGLFSYFDQNNLHRLFISKYNKSILPLVSFHDINSARNYLHRLVETNDLCPELCKIGDCEICQSNNESEHKNPDIYNKKIALALSKGNDEQKSFFIFDIGRNDEELSIIWCEPGISYAMGYVSKDISFTNKEAVLENLSTFEGSLYLSQLLIKFAKENPRKIKYFESQNKI